MSTPPPADLLALIEAPDLDGVDRYLLGLGSEELTTVRRWFERSRGWFREVRDTDDRTNWSLEGRWGLLWAEVVCAVSLMGPVTAAKRIPWRDFRWYSETDAAGERIVRRRLLEADAGWAARFVEAADGLALSRESHAAYLLAELLRAMVLHHALPCPSGNAFLSTWLSEPGGLSDRDAAAGLAQAMRDDPLMPELLWHYLGSGHCGDLPHLPGALATLVAEGLVDRTRLVETVLTQLTTLPRVTTQRVLANTLVAVEIAAAEIPGGLDYLLGVIATAHGSVGKVLLPSALELAREGDDLQQLAGVVAARPERAQKDLMLRNLRGRGDAAGVVEALGTLAMDDGDAAFIARVQQVIDRYRRADDVPADPAGESIANPRTPGPMGLWDQRPLPAADPADERWTRDRAGVLSNAWSVLLGRMPDAMDDARAWVAAETLAALADGDDPMLLLAGPAVRMLGNDALSLPRISQVFEDLFLGGVMSLTWPAALSVADAACERRPRPARLEVLLRLLARYADEAPRQELPLGIAGLAAAPGQTKTQMEARRLGAGLSGETPEAYVARIRAAGAVEAAEKAAPPPLWQERPAHWRPEVEFVPAVAQIDPEAVGRALVNSDTEPLYPIGDALAARAVPFDLTGPELLLRDVLRGTQVYGLEQWRDYLGRWARDRSEYLGPTGQAIALWAQGLLTVETFWTLALRSIAWAERDRELKAAPDHGHQEWFDALNATRNQAEQVRSSRPVLPPVLDAPPARLTFLRTAEVLLRMELEPERGLASIALPVFQDGTIDLANLVHRLHRTGPHVGPLDLVQALHRLRPSDPARAGDLDLPAVMTVPKLTSPDATESWDAAAAVRLWVASGGAGPAEAGRRTNQHGRPEWTVRYEVAVPWSTCRAAPAGLDDMFVTDAMYGPTVRVFPLQPDRAAVAGYYAGRTFLEDLVHMRGDFGPASHQLLLNRTANVNSSPTEELLDLLAALAGSGRIDPQRLAATARQMVQYKELSLPHLIPSWRRVFAGGGLALLWPIAVAVADGLASISPPPPELAQLVGLLVAFVPEVPPGAGADRVLALAGTV
jgi:hypothetical protein